MAQSVQRYACDRCHGQKLRCIRQGDGCARCAKANALCTWSPTLRGGMKAGATIPGAPANLETDPATRKRKHTDELLDLPEAVRISGEQTVDWSWSTALDGALADTEYLNEQPINPLQANQNLGQLDQLQPSDFGFESNFNVPQLETALGEAFVLPNLLHHDDEEVSNILINTPGPQGPQYSTSPNSNYLAATESPDATSFQYHDRTDVPGASSPDSNMRFASKDDAANSASSTLSAIQELSDLNVKLYGHASFIPKPPEDTTGPLSWKGKDFAIDKTFELSQGMIELLNRIYPRSKEDPLNTSSSWNLSNTNPSESRKEVSPATSQRNQSLLCIDQGSMLLVLSCYLRLIDIYDNIFGNMQACLDRSSVMTPGDYVSLPCVKVGAFAFPPTSAMQITMVLHCASELIGRLRDITQSLHPSSTTGPRTPDSQEKDASGASTTDIATTTLDAVTRRQNELIKRIKILRQSLMALDVI